MARENYFLQLELDPGVTDPILINAAIHKKRAEWSALRTHPTKGQQAILRLELLPYLQAVLTNPTLREAEAVEARRLLQAQQAAASGELDEAIAVVAAKGYILEEEWAELQRRFLGRLSLEALSQRLPVPVHSAPDDFAPALLDVSRYEEIVDRLRVVGAADLYAFLGLPHTASCAVLLARAQECSSAACQQSPNPEITARQELAGHALDLFRSEDYREIYDNTRAVQVLQELEPDIHRAAVGATIHAAALEQLERQALAQGVSCEQTRRFILQKARELGWVVEVPAGPPQIFRRCLCGRLNLSDALVCGDCGGPLEIRCAGCETTNPIDQGACRTCGLAVADLLAHNRLVRDADAALLRGDRAQAGRYLEQARTYWPRSHEVINRIKEIRQQEAEAREARANVLAAVGERRFVTAQKLLENWRNRAANAADLPEVEESIRAALTEAREYVEQARQLPPHQASTVFEQALAICPELPEAIAGLARCPPCPVVGLKARFVPRTGVVLRWKPGPGRVPAGYRIRRRKQPDGPGELVAQARETACADKAAEPGSLLWYSVEAYTPEGITGEAAGVGPVLILTEVSKLLAESSDGGVLLTWQAPPGIDRVEIYRSTDSPPPTPESPGQAPDGAVLLPVYSSRLFDTELSNDITQGYRICCVFPDLTGTPIITPGVTVTATPSAPPPILEGLRIRWAEASEEVKKTPPPAPPLKGEGSKTEEPSPQAEGSLRHSFSPSPPRAKRDGHAWSCDDGEGWGEGFLHSLSARQPVVLSWENPLEVKVVVLRSAKEPDFPIGHQIEVEQLAELGVPLSDVGTTVANDPAPDSSTPCYLIFARNRFLAAYAGTLRVLDIQRIDVRLERARLVVHWPWPENCQAARILLDGESAGNPVRRGTDDPHGTAKLTLDGQTGTRTVRVVALPPHEDGTYLTGPGKEATVRIVRQQVLRWRMEKRGILYRSAQVVVEAGRELADINRLLVIGKVNEQPRSITDGRCLGRWRSSDGLHADGSIRIELASWKEARGEVFCRVFAEPAEGVTYHGPPTPETVL